MKINSLVFIQKTTLKIYQELGPPTPLLGSWIWIHVHSSCPFPKISYILYMFNNISAKCIVMNGNSQFSLVLTVFQLAQKMDRTRGMRLHPRTTISLFLNKYWIFGLKADASGIWVSGSLTPQQWFNNETLQRYSTRLGYLNQDWFSKF